MPIERVGEFWISQDLMMNTPALGLESSQLEACVRKARDDHFKVVFGHHSFGFQEKSLDVLRELPWLEGIWFWDVDLKDIDGVYALNNLKHFGVHEKRPAIDFSKLPEIEHLTLHYKKQDRGIETLQRVEKYDLWHFSPKDKTYRDLLVPVQPSKMKLCWANPSSLEGLPGRPSLQSLEIHRCRNLEDMSLIPVLFPNLERLIITTSGKVKFEQVQQVAAKLPRINEALVDGKDAR